MYVRKFRKGDENAVSDIIRTTLYVSNSKDYPTDFIEENIKSHSPEVIVPRAAESHFYVAVDGRKIIGCGGITGYWGSDKAYDDYFKGQLTELLTNYGDVFSVWLDGACGEGPNGKKQYYDWDRYYKTIRELQPGACINVCGPDVRWCGNEAGHTRKAEWSVVPARTRDTEKIAENSQQEDNEEFRQRKISAWDADLGSREILENEDDLVWYPAEVNTSIRPGWFWHESENDKVRPLDELMNIYYNSVGANATFLLNIPPTNEGLFHENDVKRLSEIGDYLRKAFAENTTETADITYNGTAIKSKILSDSYDDYFVSDTPSAVVTLRWDAPIKFNFFRAPTDNDTMKGDWYRAHLHDYDTKIYSIKTEMQDNAVRITVKQSFGWNMYQPFAKGEVIYTIDGNGVLNIKCEAETSNKVTFLPRFGIRLFMSKTFDRVEYFGYGPYESYSDKHHASYIGKFDCNIADMYEDYIRPQENSSHFGCKYMTVYSPDRSVTFASSADFSFNASEYTEEELAEKRHNYELKQCGSNVICVDAMMAGVGSASCGPALNEKYRLPLPKISLDFTMIFSNKEII
ncbi:MAG: alpha-L-fucosidase [Oscillospiraceae bacterium]